MKKILFLILIFLKLQDVNSLNSEKLLFGIGTILGISTFAVAISDLNTNNIFKIIEETAPISDSVYNIRQECAKRGIKIRQDGISYLLIIAGLFCTKYCYDRYPLN